MKHFNYLLIILALLLMSCGQKEKNQLPRLFEGKAQKIIGEIIELDKELLGMPACVSELIDSLLFVYDWKKAEKKMLFVIDLKNKKLLNKYVNIGWGPCEFSIIRDVTKLPDSKKICFTELNKAAVFTMDVDSISSLSSYENCPTILLNMRDSTKGIKTDFSNIVPIDDSRFVARGGFGADSIMYFHINENGKTIPSQIEYPKLFSGKEDWVVSLQYYYGSINPRPNQKQFAYVSKAGLLDIVELKDSELKLKTRKILYKRKFRVVKDHNMPIPIVDKKEVTGFLSSDATEQYIYITFCQLTREEAVKSMSEPSYIVYIFDWQGNPVKKLILNKPIYSINVDEHDKTLYGIYYDPEPTVVKYNLDI